MNRPPGSSHSSERWLLVSDVDDTLLGDELALQKLNDEIVKAPISLIVAYNSSRPCASLRRSIEAVPELQVPDYLIGALGTEIQEGHSGDFLSRYTLYIDHEWDRGSLATMAANMGLSPHNDQYQTEFKASYDVTSPEEYPLLVTQTRSQGIEAKIIYSGGTNLDFIPIRAGKGEAIHFLCQFLGIDPDRVVVAGDSGNDIEMFISPHKGIVVGNADEDLKGLQGDNIYHATASYAGGVLEGLYYWGVFS